jgi:hypothetical protein
MELGDPSGSPGAVECSPLRRIQPSPRRPRRRRRRRGCLSSRFVLLQRLGLRNRTGVVGFPDPAAASPFPDRPCGLPGLAVPRSSRSGFIHSCSLRPVQRTSRQGRVAPRGAPPPSMRFPAPSRHRSPESSCRRRPRSTTFRPCRFARLRRFAPPSISPVCFTRLPRSGFAPQGVVPVSWPYGLVVRHRPPRRLAAARCRSLPRRRAPWPRPRGLVSRNPCVASRRRLAVAPLAPLSSFVLPRVLLTAPVR